MKVSDKVVQDLRTLVEKSDASRRPIACRKKVM